VRTALDSSASAENSSFAAFSSALDEKSESLGTVYDTQSHQPLQRRYSLAQHLSAG